MRINRRQSFLLVVDAHTKLAAAMSERERTLKNISILMKSAARLEVPVLISEHYKKGLGPTLPEIAALAPAAACMQKIHFACTDEAECMARMSALQRHQVVVSGMEAHICVLQTAMGLKQAGYQPYVVQDASTSRTPENHAAGMQRLRAAGIPVVTTEMVVFEWLERAATPEFSELLALIK
ncbi:MAG: isochorismatase family protein [Burkholderiales bacterium]